MRGDIDASALPDFGFGHRSLIWWGTVGFIVVEGTVFVLLLAMYLFGLSQSAAFPVRRFAPDLFLGTLNTGVLLASCWPNHLYKTAAEKLDARKARLWLMVALIFGVAFLVIRAFEFSALKLRWDANFYGSMLWVILGFHTVHLLTDVIDSVVLATLAFKGTLDGHRFTDISANGAYWWFVVLIWIPIYVVIYLLPHLGQGGGV